MRKPEGKRWRNMATTQTKIPTEVPSPEPPRLGVLMANLVSMRWQKAKPPVIEDGDQRTVVESYLGWVLALQPVSNHCRPLEWVFLREDIIDH
jgi:hypothetical protein